MRLPAAIGLALLLLGAGVSGSAAPAVLAEWTFNRPGDLEGWQPNGHLADVTITNGALSCRAAGSDPILELRPLLDIKASPLQMVEIRLKTDRDGVAELFWSNTSTGRYGGFSQEKSTRFSVRGDSAWHSYRLLPFWHAEGKIVRLRFDVYDGARFDLAQIRVVDLGARPGVVESGFGKEFAGWQWFEPVSDGQEPEAEGAGRRARGGSGFWLSPLVALDATTNGFVSISMSVDRGGQGTLFYATDRGNGLHSRSFRLEPGGRERTYNLDMLESAGWGGRVVALGLRPSEDTNAVVTVRQLKVAAAPEGPPQLRVGSFGLEEVLPRAGLPATLTAIVANTGAETASNLQASIQLPPGMELKGAASPGPGIATLGFGQETTFKWNVLARRPVEGQARLTVKAANADAVTAAGECRFTPRVVVRSNGYVPEPRPLRGPYEVGVYYFPGWKTASQWQPLQKFPERKPVLGWYREGDPEVADWHIKWAVEHGITFFAYDWYWSKGVRQLEHALHDGYFKARYHHLLKFCLLWANHNPPKSSSFEDCLEVTRYWIENYFKRPEHLVFEGKPVVIIFAPDRFTEDMGSDGVKRAFEAMRAECRGAGLKGLYLIACIGDAGGARRAAEEGYDAVTAYNWPGLGMTGEGKFAPYEPLIEGYRRQWEHLIAEGRVPLVPLPVCGGWDSRPWHGENNLVRFGRTPELFKRHLINARRLLASDRSKSGTPKAILIEAWNEWGEGSYIEPHAEFGFGYLDAVRDVFATPYTEHEDITPADAGRGPYDVPPAEPARTAWDFSRPEQAWSDTMQLAELKVGGGGLSARTAGNDPAFFGPPMRARASDFDVVSLRMRLTAGDGEKAEDAGQLFWATSRLTESESTSVRFPVRVDGEWHEYQVPVAQNPRWRGTITRLRLDPGTRPDVKVELEWLRLGKRQ